MPYIKTSVSNYEPFANRWRQTDHSMFRPQMTEVGKKVTGWPQAGLCEFYLSNTSLSCLRFSFSFLLPTSYCFLLYTLQFYLITRMSLNISLFWKLLFPGLCFQIFHDSAQIFSLPKSHLCPSFICICSSLCTKQPFHISTRIFSSM